MNILEKKENKITEKVLFRTLAMSVIGILLCMIGLVGTTWAWFTAEIISGPNTLQCADYAVQMYIDGSLIENPVLLTEGNYTVKLEMTMDDVPDAEGYCELRFTLGENQEEVFYTGKLSTADVFCFNLKVDESVSSTVTVSPCWGELPQFGQGEKDRMIGENGLHISTTGVEHMQNSDAFDENNGVSTDGDSTEPGSGTIEGEENPVELSDETVEY